jgi:cell wall-associated NlpC family hydrolase
VGLGRPATRGALARALAAVPTRDLAERLTLAPPAVPGAPSGRVSLGEARLAFVRALGLEAERLALQSLRTEDGTPLRMPRNAGSEILARELGMVPNLPEPLEDLERSAAEPLRYADLVAMADVARQVEGWRLWGMTRYQGIVLPDMGAAQRRVVQAALSQIGTPYVWGGEWPGAASPFGPQAVGGFDCSGLVWWSFSGPPDLRTSGLGDGLGWRTTADRMAFSRTAGARVPLRLTRAGDLVFFGPKGRRTRRGHISHVAIALGGGWIVHSSGSRGGPSISHLEDYWTAGAAFARRPPALAPPSVPA